MSRINRPNLLGLKVESADNGLVHASTSKTIHF
jgi:hypothetical protein